jgi:hypothetical protein
MCKENSNLIDNKVYDHAYIDVTTVLKNKKYISCMLPKVILEKGNRNYVNI